MRRMLSGSLFARSVDVFLCYLIAIAFWYNWEFVINWVAVMVLFWFTVRCLREEAVAGSLKGYIVPEKLLMCMLKAAYNMSFFVLATFCIISAVDALDDSSGLLDWGLNLPVSMGTPEPSALRDVVGVLLLMTVSRLVLMLYAGIRQRDSLTRNAQTED
jgi:membrane-associated HD superfamily phosphohydrolase